MNFLFGNDMQSAALYTGEQNVASVALLKRLGFEERIAEILPTDILLPAIGQGALGIETKMDDKEIEGLIQFLNDQDSSVAVSAERAFCACQRS